MKREGKGIFKHRKRSAAKTSGIQGQRSAVGPKLFKSQQIRGNEGTSSAGEDSEDEEKEGPSQSDEDSEPDIDEPRVAQWEAEDEDENMSGLDSEEDKEEGPSKLTRETPSAGISSLSYGSLLKARRVLDQARVESGSDGSESEEDPAESQKTSKDWIRSNQDHTQERPKIKKAEKRAHKHAPTEMTSKRPVTRRRQVVDVKKVNYRDPRFSEFASDGLSGTFQKHYSFLADMHEGELDTLKENLKRARNMVRSSPRDQREAREQEVERLERAYKRAESSVNRDRREAVERHALEQAHKEEKERRRAGKRDWYMKDSAKKELLLRARHDTLAETGGRFAVRKAIEKRQKKVSQKEKRQRPSFVGRAGRGEEADGRGPAKRRKAAA